MIRATQRSLSMRALDITIFGIVTISLDVGIVNVFVFHAIWVRLHPDFSTNAFGHALLRQPKM